MGRIDYTIAGTGTRSLHVRTRDAPQNQDSLLWVIPRKELEPQSYNKKRTNSANNLNIRRDSSSESVARSIIP